MSEFELSLSPNYAADWKLTDAVREIFQNAVDQQTVQPNNAMFFDYEAGQQILRIGNKSSILQAKSLLLGNTTKANDVNTIGQFGEGYKIATLVLLRLGKKITFYNYGAGEVWVPRFKNSKRYGAKILVFDIKQYSWKKIPNNNLNIVIEGITDEEYKDIIESNLNMQNMSEILIEQTTEGRILLDEQYEGKVYVSGLFVTHLDTLRYGYDFKPQYLPLGRDRNMVRSIDIAWETSRMWQEIGGDIMLQLIRKDAYDVTYIKNTAPNKSNMATVVEKAKEAFTEEYGTKAIPVSNQTEADTVQQKYKDAQPIIVNETHKHVLNSEGTFVPKDATLRTVEKEDDNATLIQKLQTWYKSIKCNISFSKEDEFNTIFDELECYVEQLIEDQQHCVNNHEGMD
jgi:hypothetical protein